MNSVDSDGIGWEASGRGGVVAGGDSRAVAAGIRILEQDGNAADAAAATILALNVTDHGACSIGGEVPLLIYEARREEVRALSGQGRAPRSREAIDWYMENGIPGEGDIKMAPVPSVVDLCLTTVKRYGTMSFEEIAVPTLKLLREGDEVWHPRLHTTLVRMIEEERSWSGSREEKLQAACDRFYGRGGVEGDIAGELVDYYRQKGGFLRREDLACHITTVEDPVSVNYRDYTVYKCGPWTQGPYLCQALRILEGFDLGTMGHLSADYIHTVIEAVKLAMADRDEYYGDPDFVGVPLSLLLSDAYTELRRPLIAEKASQKARPGDPYHMRPVKKEGFFRPGVGGTTTCVVADRHGNVVAATPSANVPLDKTDGGPAGVTYGNRLRSFNTQPGHPNCIQPGKRPRITLTPTLVLREGRPVFAVSVAGGDLQDQVTLNLLLDCIEFGMEPREAVTTPRFATRHHQDSFDPDPDRGRAFLEAGSLTVNETLSREVRDDLGGRGHKLKVETSPIAHPVMAYFTAGGQMYAAGDPDAGRHAAALSGE